MGPYINGYHHHLSFPTGRIGGYSRGGGAYAAPYYYIPFGDYDYGYDYDMWKAVPNCILVHRLAPTTRRCTSSWSSRRRKRIAVHQATLRRR